MGSTCCARPYATFSAFSELEVLTCVNHPNVVKVLGAYQFGADFHMVGHATRLPRHRLPRHRVQFDPGNEGLTPTVADVAGVLYATWHFHMVLQHVDGFHLIRYLMELDAEGKGGRAPADIEAERHSVLRQLARQLCHTTPHFSAQLEPLLS